MSARRTHSSLDFRLEALEGRTLLCGIPAPDASDVTLLNGQHPVANEEFLNPDEDWSIAQPGHGSDMPSFLNDDDMYDFEDEDLGWTDPWAGLNDEYAMYDDVDDLDFSGVTGLPAAATQHGRPLTIPEISFGLETPYRFDTTEAGEDVFLVPDAEGPEVTLLIPLSDEVSKASFIAFGGDASGADAHASLFVFGTAPTASLFSSPLELKKSSLAASYIDAQSADLVGL